MKKIKLLSLALAAGLFTFSLAGCTDGGSGLPPLIPFPSVDDTNGGTNNGTEAGSEDIKDPRVEIYNLAVQSGYTGTYEAWLESIKGDSIQIRNNNGILEWKYTKQEAWTTLVNLNDYLGQGGSGLSAYEIYVKHHPEYTGTEEEWLNDLVTGNLVTTKHTVTFKYNDEILGTKEVYHDHILDIPTYTIPGYKIVGWSTDEYRWIFDQYTVRHDTTLYANVEESTVKLTLNPGYDGGETKEIIIKPNVDFELMPATRPGYTFLGWYKEDGEKVEVFNSNLDLTLTARWEKSKELIVWCSNNTYQVTVDLLDKFKQANPSFEYEFKVENVSETDVETYLKNGRFADIYSYINDKNDRLAKAGYLSEIPHKNLDYLNSIMAPSYIKSGTARDGKTYGYTYTMDNGYFLYYDKSVLSADDVSNFDTMLAKLESKKKALVMALDDSWYDAGFFFGTGCSFKVDYDSEGNETLINCDFNSAKGLVAAKAMMNIATHKNKGFINGNNDVIASEFAAGKGAAAITGTWNAYVIKEYLGENYAATKLPEFTVDGVNYQMGSFSGGKLYGVNPKSLNLNAAHEVAKYLVSEEAQLYRYKETMIAPSATSVQNSPEVKSDIALSALMLQNQFATPQESVPYNYWDAVGTFGKAIISDSDDKITNENVQAKLDKMVKLITTVIPSSTYMRNAHRNLTTLYRF